MSYTKLFGSMLDSTVWDLPNHVRIVWVSLIGMADENGNVDAVASAISRRANIELDLVLDALDRLSRPVAHLCTELDGRLIAPLARGWKVSLAPLPRTSRRVARDPARVFTYGIWANSLDGEMVKFGKSLNPSARLAELQIGSPLELRLIWSALGDRERELHERFSSARARGEWFFMDADIRAFLRREGAQ